MARVEEPIDARFGTAPEAPAESRPESALARLPWGSFFIIVVLVLWLMFIFTTFAMSSKPNTTLTVVLCVCILSAAGALYLILELGLPFGGLMQVSNDSLRDALTPI